MKRQRQSLAIYVPVAITQLSYTMIRLVIKKVLLKYVAAEEKHSWDDAWATQLTEHGCQRMLAEHVVKGDPLDVIIICFFMVWFGWRTVGKS